MQQVLLIYLAVLGTAFAVMMLTGAKLLIRKEGCGWVPSRLLIELRTDGCVREKRPVMQVAADGSASINVLDSDAMS